MGLFDRFRSASPSRYQHVEKALDLGDRRFVEPKAWGVDPWATILRDGKGVARPFNASLLRALARSEWTRACIERIVNDVTSIDWTLQPRRKGEKADAGDVQDGVDWLNDCNPNFTSFRDMLAMALADKLELGNAAWVKTFDGRGRIAEVGAYDVETFFVNPDVHGVVQDFYQYPRAVGGGYFQPNTSQSHPFGEPIRFAPEEVSWFTYGPRSYRHYGLSPVESLNERLQLLFITLQQETLYFKEGSIAPGIISLEGWTDAQYEEFKAYWESNVKGKPHKVPLAMGKVNYVHFGYNYQELQFLDRQSWYLKLVCAVFGVPPSYLGVAAETTNRATDMSQTSNYKRGVVRPLLDAIEQQINQTIVWPHLSKDLRFAFTPSLDLAERQTLASIHEAQLRSGTRTVNEVREEEGLKPVAWGNDAPIQFALPSLAPPPEADAGAVDGTSPEPRAVDEKGEPLAAPAAGSPSPEAAPGGPTPPSAPAVPDIQKQGLNGAQVTAILDIAQRVADGELDRVAAVAIASASFPWLPGDVVDRMIPAQGERKPEPEVPAAPPKPEDEAEPKEPAA